MSAQQVSAQQVSKIQMLVSTIEGDIPVNKLVGRKFTAIVHGKNYESANKGFESIGIRDYINKITAKDENDNYTTVFLYGQDLLKGPIWWGWTQPENLKIGDIISGDNYTEYTITDIEYAEDNEPENLESEDFEKFEMEMFVCYEPNEYILNKLLVQDY